MTARLLALGSLLGAVALGVVAQEPPPFVGTWKLNLARSRYVAVPPPRSYTATFEAVENGYRCVTDQVNSEGNSVHYEYTVRFDGKDHPVTGHPRYDAISVEKVDDRTFDWSMKKGGTVVSLGRSAFSPDGKLRTLTYTGTSSTGQRFEVTAIFERQ